VNPPGGGADDNAPESGAAYVYVRRGTTWTQQAYVKASNTGGRFGYSVAVAGDTIAIGAPTERSNATGVNGNQADKSLFAAGAAYVFVRTNQVWSQQAYLKESNTDASDELGSSIALSVALSGNTLAVGAIGEASGGGDPADNSVPGSGAVYVFTRDTVTWTQQALLKASNRDPGDQLGYSVAISGDALVAGAIGEASSATGVNGDQNDNSALIAGAAYVFSRSGTTWSQGAYVKGSNTGSRDEYGYAVAISNNTVVVGTFAERSHATGINPPNAQSDDSMRNAGAVYVYR
jgi:hypothetical protein